jgi:hypothetical protein
MGSLNDYVSFLNKLDNLKADYQLSKIRIDAVMVELSVPGQKWEIEFNTYGKTEGYQVEIEKFISNGKLYDENELDVLFREFFSD